MGANSFLLLFLKSNDLSFPVGAFCSFREDPILEGDWCVGKQAGSHKKCLSCNIDRKSARCIQSSEIETYVPGEKYKKKMVFWCTNSCLSMLSLSVSELLPMI